MEPDKATMDGLAAQLPLPDLAIEDSLQVETRPKLDSYPDLLYFAWIVPHPDDPTVPLRSLEFTDVSFFMTGNAVITTRPGPVRAIDQLLRGEIAVSNPKPSWLVHAILDRTTDDLMDTVDSGSDKLDDLENKVVEKADQSQIQVLYAIKRPAPAAAPRRPGERDVIRELARQEAWVGRDAYMYYQDVGDHLARISDEVDTYFDVSTGIMDIYLSAQNNRMNEIMKQLTAVATIFHAAHAHLRHLRDEPAHGHVAPSRRRHVGIRARRGLHGRHRGRDGRLVPKEEVVVERGSDTPAPSSPEPPRDHSHDVWSSRT